MKSANEILKDELSLRKMRNSAYSLRAFARDLGVSVTALSDFLTLKRNLSKTNLLKICHSLNLPPIERATLLHRRDPAPSPQNLQQKDDAFHLFSDWYCFAILNLPRVKNHEANTLWIAQRFGISENQAKEGLARLLRLNLIRIKDQRIIRTKKSILSNYNIPELAIKQHHQRVLQKAEKALLETGSDLQDFSTTILALDPKNIELAKKQIQKMKSKLAKRIERTHGQEFYGLTLQLFPLATSPLKK
jgi:uncharacterized protein (TIGR02147 family)